MTLTDPQYLCCPLTCPHLGLRLAAGLWERREVIGIAASKRWSRVLPCRRHRLCPLTQPVSLGYLWWWPLGAVVTQRSKMGSSSWARKHRDGSQTDKRNVCPLLWEQQYTLPTCSYTHLPHVANCILWDPELSLVFVDLEHSGLSVPTPGHPVFPEQMRRCRSWEILLFPETPSLTATSATNGSVSISSLL